jgi:hypothetical protein
MWPTLMMVSEALLTGLFHQEIKVCQVEVRDQGGEVDFRQRAVGVGVVVEEAVQRIVDDVLGRGRGLRADVEIGRGKRAADWADPGKSALG